MTLGIVLFLAVSMFITSCIVRKTILAAASAGGWLLVMVQSYTLTDYPVTFDVYMGLVLFGFAMIVVSIILGVSFLLGDKKSEENIVDSDWASIKQELDEIRQEKEDMGFLYKKPRNRSRWS